MSKKYKFEQSIYVDGKRYRIRADSQKELIDKAERKKEDAQRDTIDGNTSLQTWCEKWLETYKRDAVSENWYNDIKAHVRKLNVIGNTPLAKVKPVQIQDLLNQEKGKSFSTVKKVRDIFCGVFKQAYIEGLIEKDITKGINMPSYKVAIPRRAITTQERNAILAVAKEHKKGVFFAIMLFSGLRPSEVRALKWADIDTTSCTISVSKALDDKRNIKTPKTKSGNRTVPYYAELNKYLHSTTPFSYVVTTENGQPLTEHNYKKMWQSFKRMLHIKMGGSLYRNAIIPPYVVAEDLTPYCLRHTFCTDLEKSGVPINVASKIMGHSNINITSKIYTHYDQETVSMASNIINGQPLDKTAIKHL